MFVVNFSDFMDNPLYFNFTVHYMPGIKLKNLMLDNNTKVKVNIDSKSAYVYVE